eukprot:CAMPEP_0184063706 /NCGR_PEP_ID=MMETSP0957-20130417/1337_1 /TAXON_ID=627963 /ORGANISM="Aplanochytrium sp, Strain PBS07" /LENGTH=343 /DNA_ID=CAMNT_0026360807 /DNA_START=90 /DNA_END=1121 /DNA_ORIENTATION=-
MLLFVFLCGLFVCCNSLFSVTFSSTVYHGAVKPESLLGLLPGYVGMVAAGLLMKKLLPSKKTPEEMKAESEYLKELSGYIWKLALMHYFASVLIGFAIAFAGSSLFQVCYSAGPIFAASLQYLILGKTVSYLQLAAIVVIVVGLASLVLLKPKDAETATNGSEQTDSSVILGVIFTFTTSLCYNFKNTVAQSILQSDKSKLTLSPSVYLVELGSRCVKIELLMLLLWTTPRWMTLVVDPMKAAGTAYSTALFHYILLFFCTAGVNFSYYWIVANSSVVLLSVLTGINTVGAMTLSDFLFCDEIRQNQCMTVHKVQCSFVVVLGVISYGAASALRSSTPKEKEA